MLRYTLILWILRCAQYDKEKTSQYDKGKIVLYETKQQIKGKIALYLVAIVKSYTQKNASQPKSRQPHKASKARK